MRRLRALVFAPAILDLLVLGQRVGEQREDRDIVALHLAERLGGVLALAGILARELVEDLRLAQQLVAKRIAQARDGLVEQARPGGAADDMLLVQRLFHLVGELVRAVDAEIAQPGTVFGERRVVLPGRQVGVVELVDLELEEHQPGADIGQQFGDILREPAALGVGHVLRIVERGIGAYAAHQVVQGLEPGDRRAQRLSVHPRHLALVGLGEGIGVRRSALQVGSEIRAAGTGIEVGEAPGRQIAQHRIHSTNSLQTAAYGARAAASPERAPNRRHSGLARTADPASHERLGNFRNFR